MDQPYFYGFFDIAVFCLQAFQKHVHFFFFSPTVKPQPKATVTGSVFGRSTQYLKILNFIRLFLTYMGEFYD